MVSSEINQNLAVEGLNSPCISSPCIDMFLIFLISAKSNYITKIFVESILVQKIASTSICGIFMSPEYFEIKNKELCSG